MAKDLTRDLSKETPLMKQYWEVKSAHPDKIVLFRMGDFFELFHDDAVQAAPILDIVLTSRNKKAEDETPMCGVPHHSIANHINRLLSKGYKVAICDQIEDPKFAKGLVKRAVTRILTPGMVYDPDALDSQTANYICAWDDNSISFLEPTTGECFFYRTKDLQRKLQLIATLKPAEVLVANEAETKLLPESAHPTVFLIKESQFADLMVKGGESYTPSAKKLAVYASQMQGLEILKSLRPFEERLLSGRMHLTPVNLQHLEVFSTYRGEKNGTLFWAVDRTKTSAGARTLKQWLALPLCDEAAILGRQQRVQFWLDKPGALKNLRETLGRMGDIERRMGKLTSPQCGPHDLKAIEQSLAVGLEVSGLSEDWNEDLEELKDLVDVISKTISDEPSVSKREGGFVRLGLRTDLDELIRLATDSQTEVLKLEATEKERTGISSLKIRYNQVFGYYIEITNAHKDKVPADYLRKQTLVNAERYVTDGLQELERKVLSAKTRRAELELEVFESLRKRILDHAPLLQKLSRHWAELDVLSSLAWLAIEKRYVRPTFGKSLRLELCRHPVIEQIRKNFVPNTLELNPGEVLCLTGPNMAGKSTLMRQVALISILAQTGSYVSAHAACLPLYDRVFTRIGASDALTEGMSTFMVEMTETAQIFRNLTENSLIVLDEIGRGTSTFDGMSLAQAILEELSEKPVMTFFATHYHELTQLSDVRPQIKNAHMAIQDKDGEIQFLHILESGPANRSYGIEVAKSAGLPVSLIKRAREILKNKESSNSGHLQMNLFASEVSPEQRNDSQVSILEEELDSLDIEQLTPIQALLKLQELKTTRLNHKDN